MRTAFLLLVIMVFANSCAMLQQSSRYNFANGVYTSGGSTGAVQKVYVHNNDSSLTVYPTQRIQGRLVVDTLVQKPVVYGLQRDAVLPSPVSFGQGGFDLDFFTIPFKYRFATENFPRQFTTQLNGGVYLGYRADRYVMHYNKNPLGTLERHINHLAFSAGAFTGVGSTTMNPSVVRSPFTIEYEGVAWSKGFAIIAGFNNFTAGLALGWDHLLDKNRHVWIYQGKP